MKYTQEEISHGDQDKRMYLLIHSFIQQIFNLIGNYYVSSTVPSARDKMVN